MRIELKVIETIEQYLMGTLSPNEKTDFESQMNQNPELKSQVDLQNQIMQGIQRMALKNATQSAYKSYKLQSFLTKAIVIAVITTAATLGIMKLIENSTENPTPATYNETQSQIIFAANDSLSADANQYLEQEIFKINTQRDTLVETKDGIVIYIPADAFNTTETEVDLLIQGTLTTEDILMAGLSTVTAQGEALETGGMFYVDAYVNGKRVDLKKELTASIPTNEVKSGMQLYEGEKNASGEIVWSNPKPLEKFLTPVEITKLDFYPPDYEASLNEMGYSKKDFMDSLYYSFACENQNINSNSRTFNEAYQSGKRLFQQNCASCHSPNKDMTGPALAQSRERWIKNSSEENLYKFIRNSSAVIASGDPYANELFNKWNRSVQTSQNLTNQQIDDVLFYADWFYGREVDQTSAITIPKYDTYVVVDLPKSPRSVVLGNDTVASDNSCPGINPASIKTIWNDKFNSTNLATREFEERMPWIHKSCNNAVLELYINNLDKKLSTVDSMAFKYLSGEVLEKFKYFAARGDGRVELDNPASQKLASYFEKQRDAEAKALAETRRQFWNYQYKLDAENASAEYESSNRSAVNQGEIFEKEYKKNLCKVVTELGMNKDCNSFIPEATYTVGINSMGWKNIDQLVFEATANRETTTFSKNGKTSTITYNPWSATINDFSTFDRINVYNIPVEFNSYIKLPGANGKYTYKLNADLSYQTVVLAWTADAIYFFKAPANAGDSNITLHKVSDSEWRTEIQTSLSAVQGMAQELDYTQYMQNDQKRINTNKEKTQLRQKIEPVVFPCGTATDTTATIVGPL
ncbi:MAG: cytochrome c [Bacteroidetes bacterium]|nr:cytochrome c [Bacteroidota bacterium]